MSFSTRRLKRAERLTDVNPTQEQKESGNYRKGKVVLKGFEISIENPIGSKRSGIDRFGNSWESELNHTYGYFENTIGFDDDEIDVFIGDYIDEIFNIYIIDQVDEITKEFDEHKVMFGFSSEQEAINAYFSNYHNNWNGFENITTISIDDFRRWLYNEELTKLPAKDIKPINMDFLNSIKDDEKINIIELRGEVLEGKTLKDLMNQAKDISIGETLVLEIASPGGSVYEGIQIMLWLEALSQKGIKIITLVTANAYSIASLIMLAADIKLISRHGEVMVHNPMVPELVYVNANELEEHITSLRELEEIMYDLYGIFTGLERESIKELMDNETYLKPDEAVQKGFADMVVNIKKTPYEMACKPTKTVNMSKTVNVLNKIIAKVKGSDIVNQIYYDNEGGMVEIYQADPSQYQIGDRISMEDGDVQLADGSKLIVEGGVIKDIVQPEIIQPETEEPIVEEIVDQDGSTGELETPAATEEVVEEMVVNGDFNTGPAPGEVIKSKDDMPSTVIETTESTVTTKETVAQAQEEVVAEVVEETVAEIVEPVAEEIIEEPAIETVSVSEFKALQAQVVKMQEEFEAYKGKAEANALEDSQFKQATAEVIEEIAKSTVSGFKPEARVTASPNSKIINSIGKNSIFQKAREQRGINK